MKHKHNKKRNTAFLFESIIRELTKASLKNDNGRKKLALSIIKEFFAKDKVLALELELYKSLYKPANCSEVIAEKIINEAKDRHRRLNKNIIFEAQTELINKINIKLGKGTFENFIPNYKNLATIYQVLHEKAEVKKQINLEEKIKVHLQQENKIIEEKKYKPVSKLAFKTFYNKFNKTYDKGLLKEQKDLIKHYISSFETDDLELKIFLNEEIGRLSKEVNKKDSLEKKKDILSVLESFSKEEINNKMIEKVLKVQQLLKEIETNGN
jgi:hypothetical protein